MFYKGLFKTQWKTIATFYLINNYNSSDVTFSEASLFMISFDFKLYANTNGYLSQYTIKFPNKEDFPFVFFEWTKVLNHKKDYLFLFLDI